ncbi:hypothetical protein JHK87_022658 [Glycine soja]|nr:hypothetical protein JHK87_022658 [Glycine soja]
MQQQWVDIIGNIKEQVRNEYEEQHKRSLEEFKKELSSQIFIQLSQMGSQYSPLIEVDLQALAARLSTKGNFPHATSVDFASLFPKIGNADIHQGSNYDFTAQLARFMASLVIDVPSQAHWITQLTKYDFGGASSIGSSANSKFVADFSSSVGKKSLQHFDSKESDPKEI